MVVSLIRSGQIEIRDLASTLCKVLCRFTSQFGRMNRIGVGFVRLILPIWQDEPHKKLEMGSKVKVDVNSGQINRTADPLNNKFGY